MTAVEELDVVVVGSGDDTVFHFNEFFFIEAVPLSNNRNDAGVALEFLDVVYVIHVAVETFEEVKHKVDSLVSHVVQFINPLYLVCFVLQYLVPLLLILA